MGLFDSTSEQGQPAKSTVRLIMFTARQSQRTFAAYFSITPNDYLLVCKDAMRLSSN
jgi:hypothetical protein